MKKIIYLILVCLIQISDIKAQVSLGGTPVSQLKNLELEDLYVEQLPNMNNARLLKEAYEIAQATGFYQIGKIIPTDFSMSNSGEWIELSDGGKFWILKVSSEDAKGMTLYFNEFNLIPNSSLFVYNPDYSQVHGAFSSHNNLDGGKYAIEMIDDDELILEYYEPANSRGRSKLEIEGIAHAFREVAYIPEEPQRGFGDSDPCQINVNCPQGDAYQDQKRSASQIIVTNGVSQGACSGALINNERQNCQNLYLTADHCLGNATPAQYEQWIFLFNYETQECENPSIEPGGNSVVGAQKLASSPLVDGGADILLIEALVPIPEEYNVFYAGWNRLNSASSEGVTIHHPMADIKKISTYDTTVSEGSLTSNELTHWFVTFAEGGSEGGSSGAAMFNSTGQIVGITSGGFPSGNTAACGPEADLAGFGKISFVWESILKEWLDPENSGITTLEGRDASVCVDVTNIKELNATKHFSIFPNPSNGIFKIKSRDNSVTTKIQIINSLGEILKTRTVGNSKEFEIDISTYVQGIYFVQITSNNKQEIHSMLKLN